MVPVNVAEKVPEVIEVVTIGTLIVPEPEASAKRPVPPVTVKDPVSCKVFAEVGQMTSFVEMKTSSPFAAVRVSCSIEVNPPWHAAEPRALLLLVPARIVFPRCVIWPVPVIVAMFGGVKVKLPEKLPLKGLEWVANASGNAPSTTRATMIAGVRICLFILF